MQEEKIYLDDSGRLREAVLKIYFGFALLRELKIKAIQTITSCLSQLCQPQYM